MILTLTKGQQTLVDEDIPEWIIAKSWYALYSHGRWYACSRRRKAILLLHRVLAGAQPGETVDHINMDSLDNRRENLRCCTHGENNCSRPGLGGRSHFKGVSWHKRAGKWQAHIQKDGRNYYLGLFGTEQAAAAAYNAKARILHRQFAYLNEIGGQNGTSTHI